MPSDKEQMNVEIDREAKQLAKTCAAVSNESLNVWVEEAIREKAARDYKEYPIDRMKKDLKRVAKKYLPGKAATEEQMMAMAKLVAEEDTEDGFSPVYYREARPSKAVKATRRRGPRG
jgi:hypothetical protein